MRLNFKLLIIIWSLMISVIGCQEEDIRKDFELPINEEEQVDQTDNEIDLSILANLDKSIVEDIKLRSAGPPTNVSSINFNPTSGLLLPANGVAINVTAIGTFTYTLQLRAYDLATKQDIDNTTISGNGTSGTSILQITANTSSTVRYIMVEAYDPFTQVWKLQTLFEQAASNIAFSTNMPAEVPYTGGTYTIFKDGSYPEATGQYVFFRVVTDGDVGIVEGLIIVGPDLSSLNFTIPVNNTGSSRNLYVQYSLDYATWITFGQGVQLAENGGGGQINITYAYFTPNGADAEGSDIQVVLAGTFSEVKVRARASNKIVEGTVKKGVIYQEILSHGHQHDGGGIISIPDIGVNGWHQSYRSDLTIYNGSTGLHWDIEYYDGQNWIPILLRNENRSTVQQPTYFIKVTNPNASTYKAARTNGNWPLKIRGSWRTSGVPEVWLKVVEASNHNVMASNSLVIPNPGTMGGVGTDIDFIIPLHTNTSNRDRELVLLYSIDFGNTYQLWTRGVMPCQNWVGASSITQSR